MAGIYLKDNSFKFFHLERNFFIFCSFRFFVQQVWQRNKSFVSCQVIWVFTNSHHWKRKLNWILCRDYVIVKVSRKYISCNLFLLTLTHKFRQFQPWQRDGVEGLLCDWVVSLTRTFAITARGVYWLFSRPSRRCAYHIDAYGCHGAFQLTEKKNSELQSVFICCVSMSFSLFYPTSNLTKIFRLRFCGIEAYQITM